MKEPTLTGRYNTSSICKKMSVLLSLRKTIGIWLLKWKMKVAFKFGNLKHLNLPFCGLCPSRVWSRSNLQRLRINSTLPCPVKRIKTRVTKVLKKKPKLIVFVYFNLAGQGTLLSIGNSSTQSKGSVLCFQPAFF